MKRKISESKVKLIEIVLPGDTNQYGTIFGGYLISLMDKAAFISASRYTRKTCVTAGMDRLDFTQSIKAGEIVEISAHLNFVSRSAMEIEVEVWGENILSGKKVKACSGYFTFVAVNGKGKPVPVPEPKLETKEEIERFQEGKKRHEARARTRRQADQKASGNQVG